MTKIAGSVFLRQPDVLNNSKNPKGKNETNFSPIAGVGIWGGKQ